MKVKSFFLSTLLLMLLSAYVLPPYVSSQELIFIKQEMVREIAQLEPNYYQQRIIERNERFDGLLLISKSDRSLQFTLLTENGAALWRKPARSTWLIMAEKAPRLAMVGKMEREGYGPDLHETIFQGVDVLDFSGNLIYQLNDTGPIGQVFLSADGKLLLSASKELSLYDPNGELLWKSTTPHHQVEFLSNGPYIKTLFWNAALETYTLRLIKTSSGKVVKEWEFDRSNEKAIMFINTEKNQLLMSEFVNSSPPDWNIVLYDMSQWQPVTSLNHLKAGPFFPVWNPKENGFGFLLRRPQTPSEARAGEIMIGFWDLDDGSLVTQNLGKRKINFNEDQMIYDARSHQYHVRIGSNISVYGHSQ